ncbi:hypothetical protein STCU_00129 [Strigomonas culicis]|uniref:C3H1-type domain-containing protein n=1 Tax=Strigomonas culicis TaxID=28005 RepID=S9UBA7_9TRYP|nr:hypothetical protein STCU_06262 [Strigomonas culicis]EPY34746.1 hypothetical protein STCU_01356 [Strigomonas culicis]EPY37168.1 hypothetical protein STCU_00129 [Strigomonas culicis]|eukprot:EPY26218.1 hypothetical protein STCU_06262 [Strigomonas culicis]
METYEDDYQVDDDHDDVSIIATAVTDVTKKKKKKKKKTKRLYDQYLADSGSEASVYSEEEEEDHGLACEEFTVGSDINILVQQTVQNMIQSVCLEDYDGLSVFGDHELRCFAAAVKHNSSIVSLQIRYLDVSDVSLVPLCEALKQHPSLRALDLSGTHGGEPTSKALRELVCNNPHIIFARLDDSICNARDIAIIEEACRYNALVCPDPNNNPFQLGLLRKISAMDEKVHKYNEQLQARPWLFQDPSQDQEQERKKKKVIIASGGTGKIGAEVCPQFVLGRCAYGSRCKFIHPERTSALRNAAASSLHERSERMGDGISTNFTTATTARHRLQSRLRPSRFTFHGALVTKRSQPTSEGSSSESEEDVNQSAHDESRKRRETLVATWSLTVAIACCCGALAISM